MIITAGIINELVGGSTRELSVTKRFMQGVTIISVFPKTIKMEKGQRAHL
jgi:hypothetical protein